MTKGLEFVRVIYGGPGSKMVSVVLCVSQARYATVKSVSSQWAALPNSCRNGHCRSNPAPVILQGPLVFAKQALFGGQLY